jgi:glycosyltransferase involved in cell wall biosynthesis
MQKSNPLSGEPAQHATPAIDEPTSSQKGQSDSPKISIVMPAYNAELFIAESIESALNQTLTDFELIIVDDGSTDRTAEIANEYATRDPRIRVYKMGENVGIARATNTAVSYALAGLIGRLDADDIALPHRFERQVAEFESDPEVVVVGSNALHINEQSKILGLSLAGSNTAEEFHRRRAEGEITMVLDCTSAFRKSVFDDVGGYDPTFEAAQEIDLHSRMANYGVVLSIEEPLLLYRLHSGSVVDTQFFRGREVHRFVRERERARVDKEPPPVFETFLDDEASASLLYRSRIRLTDVAFYRYRAAGVSFSEGKRRAAFVHLAHALLANPHFVTTRLWNRRLSPSARHMMQEAVPEV